MTYLANAHPNPPTPVLRGASLVLAAAGLLACGHVGIDLDCPPRDAAAQNGDDDALLADDTKVDNDSKVDDDTVAADDDLGAADDDLGKLDASRDAALPDASRPSRPKADAGDSGSGGSGLGRRDAGHAAAWDSGLRDAGRGPRDASLGGGVSGDAGAADAAPGAGSKDAATADATSSDDPGPTLQIRACAPDCQCAGDEACRLTCGADNCWPSCGPGSDCQIDVGELGSAGIECAEGALCEAAGVLSDIAEFTCEGPGNCSASCGTARDCSMNCVGTGKCTLYCSDAESCDVRCAEDAHCFVVRQNSETLTDLECGLDLRRECSATLLSCNAECPP